MSLLAALVRAYDRLPDAPPFGYSTEKIGFCVVLNADGSVAHVEDHLTQDKKRRPKPLLVPRPKKRTREIAPSLLWDNTAYVLGVTKDGKNKVEKHAAFRALHLKALAESKDEGLVALRRFLEDWTPDQFAPPTWPEECVDLNIVFRLSTEHVFLHDRAAARELWRSIGAEGASNPQICLVRGVSAPIARLHPRIKGIRAPSGKDADSLISFNDDAYESYGHKQGDNAPISEAAAFAYTTALNRFLADKAHRLQIGDASTVFWADAADLAGTTSDEHLAEAEALFAMMFDNADTSADDTIFSNRVGSHLQAIREGQRLPEIEPRLDQGVRFHVLGLAPNAARLSVRFYWESDFGTLTANYQHYLDDMRLDPPPRDGWPPLWRYLTELAVLGKRENVPPLVAGEWMRAILTGAPYPLTLLSTVLMRLRADGDVNALRAAILKSVLIRNLKKGVPVALDPNFKESRGYLLGRLFAVYEEVQRSALGNVNATIADKFYGAASATPQKVFVTLGSGAKNHFSKLRKQSPGRAVNLEKLITSITDLMEPGDDPIPASLPTADQALFGIGYYHQRSDFFRKRDDKTSEETAE